MGCSPSFCPPPVVQAMIQAALATPGLELTVDLAAQSVTVPATPHCTGGRFRPPSASDTGRSISVRIDAYRKRCLLSGLDELDYTLTQLNKIETFEHNYSS